MSLFSKISYIIDKSFKKRIVVLLLLLFLSMVFEFIGLGIMVPILTLIVSDTAVDKYPFLKDLLASYGNPTTSVLLFWAISIMLIFYFTKTLFLLYATWKQATFNAELTRYVQNQLFDGYLHKKYSFHLDRNSAFLLNNIQSEVNYLSHITQAIMAILSDLALILGVFAMLVLVNVQLAIGILFLFALFGFILHLATRKKMKAVGKAREKHEVQMYKHVLQGLGGIKDVILSGRQKYFIEKFNIHALERKRVYAIQGLVLQIPRLYFELLSVTIIGVIVFSFILQDLRIDMILPTIGLFMVASLRIMPSANRMSASFQTLRFTQPVIDKLYAEFKDIKNATIPLPVNESFTFNNNLKISSLNFRYPSKNINALSDISLEIKKGETVGFLGKSGSGKSTLIDLVLGVQTPTGGGIFVDGTDINEILSSWQHIIGYVPQSIYLLDESIKHNIAFGIQESEISMEKVNRALKLSHLSEYVADLSEGVETIVGERGVKLSGGQKQRIGLARALYHNPEVLLLDEATSALDTLTEDEVMNAIRDLKGEKTILIIAHRTSTIAHCDRLYMLDHGKIKKSGIPADFDL